MYVLTNASIYSTNGDMAYQLTYTNEHNDIWNVRAVESKGNIIRKEYLDGNEWKECGKPYIVTKNKKRNAEKIKDAAIKFMN